MNKKEFVKSLQKVKIVLGNGFDLHCGLKTSYYHYFITKHKTIKYLNDRFNIYKATHVFTANGYHKQTININVWDVFLALNYFENKSLPHSQWFDIEKLMLSSLMSEEDAKGNISKTAMLLGTVLHWNNIEKYVDKLAQPKTDEESFLSNFIQEKIELLNQEYTDFYAFLLDQLKEFEKNFGQFVNDQLHDRYLERLNRRDFLNEKYIRNFEATLEDLCDKNNIVAIDTFNYSSLPSDRLSFKPHHINGDFQRPIFGIDSGYFTPDDKRFVFTKTGRRMDADFMDEKIDNLPEFNNVIVYGHSLNEADYNYFFPIFDKLNLLDSQKTNSIIFAFTPYDGKEKRANILRDGISKIMFAYAKSKGLTSPERFLDSLTTQQRIVMHEIPELKSDDYDNFLDENWKQIEKEYSMVSKSINIE